MAQGVGQKGFKATGREVGAQCGLHILHFIPETISKIYLFSKKKCVIDPLQILRNRKVADSNSSISCVFLHSI